MALRINSSKGARDVTILVDTANGTIAPGNTSINTTVGEIVTGLTVRGIVAGVGTGGAVTIARGANVVFQTVQSGVFNFIADGAQPIILDAAANVSVNFVGANCTAQILCGKISNNIGS